ncbi:MAG TPA: DUF58 domain-containing protein [Fibrobacteria bacterium]|nr:DUF58 domain-containing protein [Fibrobacteria bacterium]HOX51591.1 DUF58 domain-containing protein [Fibrobacteria bacterium]
MRGLRRILRIWRWFRETYPRGTDRNDPLTRSWKFFRERLSPTGKILSAACLGLFPLSLLSRGWMGGVLFVATLSLLAGALLWTIRRPRIAVRTMPPGEVRSGEIFQVRAVLESSDGSLPSGAGAWVFRTSDGLLPQGDGAPVKAEGRSAEIPIKALRRGPERIEGVTVFGQDPLGLARSRRLVREPLEVLVGPAWLEIHSMDFLVRGPDGRSFARHLVRRAGRGGEFLGARPWREGDHPRDLHHQAFARTGDPMVREFGAERGDGICLVFRSGCASWSRQALCEGAVSLCAAAARWLHARSALGRVFVDDAEVDLSGPSPISRVERALALAPRVAGWNRLPKPSPWAPSHPPLDAILMVGIAPGRAAVGAEGSEARIGRRLLVDWEGAPEHDGIRCVGIGEIAAGGIRL